MLVDDSYGQKPVAGFPCAPQSTYLVLSYSKPTCQAKRNSTTTKHLLEIYHGKFGLHLIENRQSQYFYSGTSSPETCVMKHQLYTRTYEGDNGEEVVVIGNRKDTSDPVEKVMEAEFVFRDGKLFDVHAVTSRDLPPIFVHVRIRQLSAVPSWV
jgi:hypothetical protein